MGFIKGKSTVTNLIIYVQHLLYGLEFQRQINTACTDFSKSFDRVSHGVLLAKYSGYRTIFQPMIG